MSSELDFPLLRLSSIVSKQSSLCSSLNPDFRPSTYTNKRILDPETLAFTYAYRKILLLYPIMITEMRLDSALVYFPSTASLPFPVDSLFDSTAYFRTPETALELAASLLA